MNGYFDRLKAVQGDAEKARAYNSAVRRPMNMNQGAAQAQFYGGFGNGDWGQAGVQLTQGLAAAEREKKFALDMGNFRAGLDAPDSPDKREDYYSIGEDGREVFNTAAAEKKLLADQQAAAIDRYGKLTDGEQAGMMAGGAAAEAFGRLGTDLAGGSLRAMGQADAAMARAGIAGAFADAQNARARNAVLAGAQGAAEDMNLAARAQAAGMADSAIAQANAYEAGMQGIASSGIEGSGNMERNLLYGRSRADAEEQLAFDIQGKQAGDLGAPMANSFEELSRGKVRAMSGAMGDALGEQQAALTQSRMNVSNTAFQMQAGPNDWEAALAEAEAVPGEPVYREETVAGEAARDPGSWQVPGAGFVSPDSDAAKNAAARTGSPAAGAGPPARLPVQGTLDFDGRMTQGQARAAQQQAQAPAVQQAAPQAQAQAAPRMSGQDMYAQLESYLRSPRKSADLDGEMDRLGITDPGLKARIQEAVMSGQGREVWRNKLRSVLGAG